MLKQLSRLERTRSFIIIAFAGLMAISLIFFYAPGRNASTLDPSKSTEVLARVGHEVVTVGDLTTAKEELQRRFGGQFSLAQIGYTDKRFLDDLIQKHIISQEAARLGLAASDAEVADKIRKEFKDPSSGQFVGFTRYKEIADANYGGTEHLEEQLRSEIAAQKLQAFITAGVRVSDEEVQDEFQHKNTTFDVVYAPVTASQLASKIQASDEELRAYYEQHKTDYRILEPQKKIRYLFISQSKVGEKLNITDEELRAEYDKLTDENKQAGVKVQQIVLKIANPALESTVKAKADQLVAKARNESGNATEEAFGELARGNSEDPATAKNNGLVSGVVKKNPNKKDDPYQRVLDLQEGAVTDPIKYNNAYYILRRGAAVPKTFEEAKEELRVSLRTRKAFSVASEIAKRAAARLKETKDAQKVAQEFAAEANTTAADMVRTTDFVKPGDAVKDIGSSQQFEEAIAPLENENDVGEQTQIKDGFAVPQLVAKKDPRVPDYDEVKDKVRQAFQQERATSQLEAKARELAQSTNSAGDFKVAADKLGLTAETADAYKLGTALGEAGTSPVIDEAIYGLKPGEVAKTPIKIGDSWVVVGVIKRTDADLAEFAKKRDELAGSALSARRDQVFSDYIAGARERMQRDGQIKIDDQVLAKLSEDDVAPAAMPARQRLPVFPTK